MSQIHKGFDGRSAGALLAAVLMLAVGVSGCLQADVTVKTSCAEEAADAMAAAAPIIGADAEYASATAAGVLDDTQHEPLRIGTLLALTGELALFGPDMQNATVLAVEQINAAGGVNGMDVEVHHEDTETSTTAGPQAFQRLVNQGVVGVVGALSSGVTGSILDAAIDSNVVVVTPASTSPDLTRNRDNEGWFYRVPPDDSLQGKVLAQLVYDAECRSVNILAVNNDYGVGLGNVFQQTFESLGGSVGDMVTYPEEATTFSSEVERVGQGSPDAIVYIGYPGEGAQIMKEAFQKGIMAESVFFFSEGVKDPEFVQDVGQDADGNWVLAGLQGTTPETPTSNATTKFVDAYEARFDGDEPGLFAKEAYDAVIGIALAAQAGGGNTGADVKANIRDVWNSPGTQYDGSELSLALTSAAIGTDIDYVGAAHDFDWDEKGDPAEGVYALWKVEANGTIVTTESGITP